MAVQLARLSLWLATLAADRPLSFLDHHLQAGDSLIGAWLASLRRPPIPERGARRHAALAALRRRRRLDDAAACAPLPVRFSLAVEPNDTLEQVREKERALGGARPAGHAARRVEARRGPVVRPLVRGAGHPLPAVGVQRAVGRDPRRRGALPAADRAAAISTTAEAIAAARRFFHWELEFPEVFFDATAAPAATPGFDAVIGNPPWDMIRADAGPADARGRVPVPTSGRLLRFTRDAGVYAAQSDGHANRYQLFVERAVALTRPGGRIGLVLPSGLADRSRQRAAPAPALLAAATSTRSSDSTTGDGVFPDPSQRRGSCC